MPGPVAAIAGASLVGGVAQAGAARSASKAMGAAAAQDMAFQRETRDQIIERVDPFYRGGMLAHDAYLHNMGLAPAPTIGGQQPAIQVMRGGAPQPSQGFSSPGLSSQRGPAGQIMSGLLDGTFNIANHLGNRQHSQGNQYSVGGHVFNSMDDAQAWARANPEGGQQYGGFQATPGYQFRFDQGTQAVNALAGARGGLNSGRTMQDLNRFGQGIAADEFGTYMNRLAGLSDQGMGAAALQANASQNAAAGTSNALAAMGNAQAAGRVGTGLAISGGINNAIGGWQYQQMLGRS